MVSCIIIEDQPHAQNILIQYIEDLGMLDLRGTFGDPLGALQFLKKNNIDLIFLDIHLPKLSGIDFLNVLSPMPKIIFTTAFSEYAVQGYELDAVDYLLKPFSFKRMLQAVSKAVRTLELEGNTNEELDNKPKGHLFIKSGAVYLQIEHKLIRYIKSDGDYTLVYTAQKKHLASHSLKFWLQNLSTTHFTQVHKSYIVNVHAIQKVSAHHIYMDEVRIPIGRTFRDAFYSVYLKGLS